MPESYYSSAGYSHPAEYYINLNSGRAAGSVAPSTTTTSSASQSTIRPPAYVNSQGQLGIDYPVSQTSSSRASRQSQHGSYHSLRDVDPSDSSSQVGSVVSTSSRASRASTVRPEDSLSQVGASSSSSSSSPSSSSRTHHRGRDLSARELSLLHSQGGSHAPTVVSLASSTSHSQSQFRDHQGPQLLPYADDSDAGSNISSDSTLVIDMRDVNIRDNRRQRSSNHQGQQGNGGGDNGGSGRSTYPSEPPTVVVTEADIARGRDMWPGLDRESIKCRMKVVLIREKVQERAMVHLGFR